MVIDLLDFTVWLDEILRDERRDKRAPTVTVKWDDYEIPVHVLGDKMSLVAGFLVDQGVPREAIECFNGCTADELLRGLNRNTNLDLSTLVWDALQQADEQGAEMTWGEVAKMLRLTAFVW